MRSHRHLPSPQLNWILIWVKCFLGGPSTLFGSLAGSQTHLSIPNANAAQGFLSISSRFFSRNSSLEEHMPGKRSDPCSLCRQLQHQPWPSQNLHGVVRLPAWAPDFILSSTSRGVKLGHQQLMLHKLRQSHWKKTGCAPFLCGCTHGITILPSGHSLH